MVSWGEVSIGVLSIAGFQLRGMGGGKSSSSMRQAMTGACRSSSLTQHCVKRALDFG
jgi:hypothetical protein